MKAKLILSANVGWVLGTIVQSVAQGYIVPNGVVQSSYVPAIGYQIDVIHDPTNSYYTGFALRPEGANAFAFNPIVDVGVRVFLVSANDPISLQPILAQTYTELLNPNAYVFTSGIPFYVGLYTGNQPFAPPNGIYNDPLFGWARLVNNNGAIQLLDSALAYKAGGIYAGTQNLIPVPEPTTVGLIVLGALLLGWRLHKSRSSSAHR